MGPNPLEPLFNPKSVAVFGASESGSSVGSQVLTNLIAGGFNGPIVPINPKYDTVGGRRCFAPIKNVDESIDLAVIATPARTVEEIIRQCGDAGVRHAIILSVGFRETGAAGAACEEKRLDIAKRSGVRFIGVPTKNGFVTNSPAFSAVIA